MCTQVDSVRAGQFVRPLPTARGMDSKDREAGALQFSPYAWRAFVRHLADH
ncbi:DUF397 domain-containing protein [Plantactinospora sp. DSM 117369]